jgi:hypothetical protein
MLVDNQPAILAGLSTLVEGRLTGEQFPEVRDFELISTDREDWSCVLSSIHDLTDEVDTANRLRGYQQELRSLAGKISSTGEGGRRRITSDLHDSSIWPVGWRIGGNCFVVTADAGMMFR